MLHSLLPRLKQVGEICSAESVGICIIVGHRRFLAVGLAAASVVWFAGRVVLARGDRGVWLIHVVFWPRFNLDTGFSYPHLIVYV